MEIPDTKVVSSGETVVKTKINNDIIRIKINTKEIQIGKPSDERPDTNVNCCTYSKYPCSKVERIEININNQGIFIPASVYCNLADLNKLSIKSIGKEYMLILTGGDASEAYMVKIYFNKERVMKKIISSLITPDTPSEETKYYMQTIGD
jgi:hypothetical protein